MADSAILTGRVTILTSMLRVINTYVCDMASLSGFASYVGQRLYDAGLRKADELARELYRQQVAHVRARERIDRKAGFAHPISLADAMDGYERLDLEPTSSAFPSKARSRRRRTVGGRIRPYRYKRPAGGRAGGRRKYRRGKATRRVRRYRGRARRSGLRGRRFGGRGRNRRLRRRQGLKAKVRKIVGSCFNQVKVAQSFLLAPAFADRIQKPVLFRVCSSWFNVREDFLRLMNGTFSGPSTTVGTDLFTNKHLWPQSCYQQIDLSTPSQFGCRYKLYKCSLKCRENGNGTSGTYVEGTLPFALGSAFSNDNAPTHAMWGFFNQDSRLVTGPFVADDTTYMPFSSDGQLAKNGFNSGGTVTPAAGSDFEISSSASSGTPHYSAMEPPLTYLLHQLCF